MALPNMSERVVLGLDVGGTRVRAALARGREVLASASAVWPAARPPGEELAFVADLALDLARRAAPDAELAAAGVALAALLDADGVVADWPNRPAWRGLAVQAELATHLGVPTVVEDDANAAAVAEWAFGAGRGLRHVLVVMAGTGVGAGLILEGRLFRGRHGWAGELGHVIVQADGPACPCGRRGCLQALAAGRALEAAAAAQGLDGVAALAAAAERGQGWARLALADSGRWLGLAAANVVNLLDLEAVVVGGGLSDLGALWWTPLREAFQANLLTPAHRRVELGRAALPDTAGVLGAVSLAQQLAGV